MFSAEGLTKVLTSCSHVLVSLWWIYSTHESHTNHRQEPSCHCWHYWHFFGIIFAIRHPACAGDDLSDQHWHKFGTVQVSQKLEFGSLATPHHSCLKVTSKQQLHSQINFVMDLGAQVSALVGTSALIFLLTKPKEESHEEAVMELTNPRRLKGAFRYSPDHRTRYFQYQESMMSSISDESSSVGSERSNDTT